MVECGVHSIAVRRAISTRRRCRRIAFGRVRRLAFGPEEQFETQLGSTGDPSRSKDTAARRADFRRPCITWSAGSRELPCGRIARVSPCFPRRADDQSEPSNLTETRAAHARRCWRYRVGRVRKFSSDGIGRRRSISTASARSGMGTWSKGRVMLIGDAACAVSLLAGEGTGLAIMQAYVLAGELEAVQGDYGTAFRTTRNRLRAFVEGKRIAAGSSPPRSS